jgi:uncharacterized protein
MTSIEIASSARDSRHAHPGRALTPDLARGAMLLFIALANSANVVFASQPGLDPTPTGAGRILNFLLAAFVDSRAYPVFAVMFGYGLVQLARRRGGGAGDARRILLRRNGWLVGFGLVHAALLYFGDFLAAYGIVGIIATLLLLNRSDRFHRAVLWVWGAQLVYVIVLAALLVARLAADTGGHAMLQNSPNPSLAAPTYVQSVVERLAEWPVHTATVIPFIIVVWLGMWAARRRLLEDPAQHRSLLAWTAAVCLTVTVAGGLPYALLSAGVLDVSPAAVEQMAILHAVSGGYGGPGYVALIALVGMWLSTKDAASPVGRATAAVSALGRRSLSGYLFQSVVWAVLLAPWGMALGGPAGDAFVAAGIAILAWAASVAAASRLEEWGMAGPAERVLRRLTYGRRPANHTARS